MKRILKKNIPHQNASKALALEIYEDFLKDSEKFTLYVEGNLGAGKSFIIREILQNFGITQTIASPTYTLMNDYKINNKILAHFDFYRLEEPQDFYNRGFQEIMTESNTSSFIEWDKNMPQEVKDSIEGDIFILRINFGLGVGMRKIEFLKV